MAAHEDIRALIRHHMEEMWHARQPHIVEHTTHGHRTTQGLTGDEVRGHEQHKELISSYQEAFSDLRFRIEHLIVEGEWAAARVVMHGKHTGAFMGIPATGKEVTISSIRLDHVQEGKITQTLLEWDKLSLLQQLGVAVGLPGQSQP